MSREIKKLTSTRGAVFLETAFVMPIFMILLCITVDLPRILSARQRLVGASRLVAEIRARNNGEQVLDGEGIKPYFFDSKSAKSIKLSINNPPVEYSTIGGAASYIKNNWGEFGKIINFLGNLISGGNFDPYFVNVFDKDKFYGGSVSAEMPTLLPAAAYTAFTQQGAPTSDIRGLTCYMPNTDSCKYTGESFIEDMLKWLRNHFGI